MFDFRRYLEQQGIYWTGTIRSPRLITVLERGWHGPDRGKHWLQARLERPFHSDLNIQGLISGMLLGRNDGLTAEVERQFQAMPQSELVIAFDGLLGMIIDAAIADESAEAARGQVVAMRLAQAVAPR